MRKAIISLFLLFVSLSPGHDHQSSIPVLKDGIVGTKIFDGAGKTLVLSDEKNIKSWVGFSTEKYEISNIQKAWLCLYIEDVISQGEFTLSLLKEKPSSEHNTSKLSAHSEIIDTKSLKSANAESIVFINITKELKSSDFLGFLLSPKEGKNLNCVISSKEGAFPPYILFKRISLDPIESPQKKELVEKSGIASNAIDSNKIEDGSISASDLKSQAVTSSKIAPNSIDSSKIKSGSISSSHIKSVSFDKITGFGDITESKIAPNSIDSSKIKNGSISAPDIKDHAVTGSKVAPNAIDSSKIKNGGISSSDIKDHAVTGSKVAPNAVDSSKIKNGSISSSDIKSVSFDKITGFEDITESKIANGAISTAKLADKAVDAEKIDDNVITQSHINPSTWNQMTSTAHTHSGQILQPNALKVGPNSPAFQIITWRFPIKQSSYSFVFEDEGSEVCPNPRGIIGLFGIVTNGTRKIPMGIDNYNPSPGSYGDNYWEAIYIPGIKDELKIKASNEIVNDTAVVFCIYLNLE